MTQANPRNYELAQSRVSQGLWTVDAEMGVVCGVKGAPFRRTNTWGYIQIKFRDPDNWRVEHAALAHRVIWESVHGPLSPSLTINHIDGDKQNNGLANLEAVTQGDNVRHAFATGLNQHTAKQAECNRGHAFNEANTRHNARGDRTCRACDRERQAVLREKRGRIAPGAGAKG